jgi:hypothetical protein
MNSNYKKLKIIRIKAPLNPKFIIFLIKLFLEIINKDLDIDGYIIFKSI